MSFLKYEAYKDSGVEWLGEVPEHWEVICTKRFLRLVTESAPPNNDMELLSVYTDIGVKPRKELEQKGNKASTTDGYWLVQKGDLIVNKLLAWMGAVGHSEYEGVTSPAYDILRPTRKLSSKYYHYLFRGKSAQQEFKRWSRGIMEMRLRLYFDELGHISMPFPPPNEQVQITNFLDHESARIDALIAEQQRLIELLKEKRQAVISHAVTKGLDPTASLKDSGVEWLGEVPAHWGIGALTRIAERVVVGIAEAATHAYSDEGVPILRSTNIRAGKIIGELLHVKEEFADERGSKTLKAGDLVTVRTGNAGVTAIVPQELDNCQCFTLLITSLNERANSEFYCYYINSSYAQNYFHVEGWGTAQVNISVPILKTLPTPIPPYAEQKEIVSFVNYESAKIDTLLAQAQEGIVLLQERRSALISAAVTGKIDVRGWHPPVLPPP